MSCLGTLPDVIFPWTIYNITNHSFVLRMTRDIRIYLKTLADNGTEFLHGSNSLGRLSHSQFILPFHSQHRFVPSALALH